MSLPLHPSAMYGNLSVTAPVLGLLLLAWATYRKRQSTYLGVSEPVGRFSLILAIKQSGEACHSAAGMDAGRGWWAKAYGHREADLVLPVTKQTLSSLLGPK